MSETKTMSENMQVLKAELAPKAESVPSAVPTSTVVKQKKEKKTAPATPKTPDAPHQYRFKISNYFTEGKGIHSGYTDSLDQIYKIYNRTDTPKPAKIFERSETGKFDIQLKIADIKKRLKESLKLS
jgi:hypothetical protein